jgi:hypothetical protein
MDFWNDDIVFEKYVFKKYGVVMSKLKSKKKNHHQMKNVKIKCIKKFNTRN